MLKIISRKEWGARDAKAFQPNPLSESSVVFIHHSAASGRKVDTFAEQCATIRGIQDFHMNSRGWDDIAYSYVVFQPRGGIHEARAFEARTYHHVPAAQLDHNTGNGAICVVGNLNVEGVARNTRYVIEELARLFPGRNLGGHRDVNQTDCPGDHLYAVLPTIARASGKTILPRG